MIKRLFTFVIAIMLLLSTGCQSIVGSLSSSAITNNSSFYNHPCSRMNESDEEVFHSKLSDLCSQELWNSRDCYDACSYMMIPMHYSFMSGDYEAIECFHDFFGNFAEFYQSGAEEFNEIRRINRLQFIYLCSQYLALCSCSAAYNEFFIPELLDIIIEQAEDNLFYSEATWHTEDTVEEHLIQVLKGKQYKKHYYSLVTDADMFTLAILCDAIYASRVFGYTITEEMNEAASLAYELFSSELLNTETDDGGWLFQVGVWQDHPDYLYAGNTEITEDMQENPREDIVWDVSHFRRLALFLTSYESAQQTEAGQQLFELRREQLSVQLKKCLVYVDGNWVQTSFMDGTNGVFRYEYNEEGVGHSGYSHSASVIQGWWVLLYQDWIFDAYQDILSGFPWPDDETNPYWDNMTVRDQNPYFDADTGWDNGWYECVMICAVQLGTTA